MKYLKFYDPNGGGGGGLTAIDRTKTDYDAQLDASFDVGQWGEGEQEFFDFGQRSWQATQRNLDINPFETVAPERVDTQGQRLGEMSAPEEDSWWITDAMDNFMGTINEIELSSARGKHKEIMRPLIEADAKIAELEQMKMTAYLANQPGLAMEYERQLDEAKKGKEQLEKDMDAPVPLIGKSKRALLEEQIKAEEGDVEYWGKGSMSYQLNNALAKNVDASLIDKMMFKWSEDIAGSYSDMKNTILQVATSRAAQWAATALTAGLTGGTSLAVQAGVWAASSLIDYGITNAMRENETYAELDEGYDSRYKELVRQKQEELKLRGEQRDLTEAEKARIAADSYKGWDEAKAANMSLQWLDMATGLLVKAPLARTFAKNKNLGFWTGTVPGVVTGAALDLYGEKIEEGLQYAFKENYVKHGDQRAWDSIGAMDVVKDITWGGSYNSQLRSAKDYVDAVDSVIAGQVINVGAAQNAKETFVAYGEQKKAAAAVTEMLKDQTSDKWGKKEALNRAEQIKKAVASGNTGKIAETLTMRGLFGRSEEEKAAIKDIRDELFAAHEAYSAMTPDNLVKKMFNPNFEARPTERIDAMNQAIKNVRAKKAKEFVESSIESLSKESFANHKEYNERVKEILDKARKVGLDYLSSGQLDTLVKDIVEGFPLDASKFTHTGFKSLPDTNEGVSESVTSISSSLKSKADNYDARIKDLKQEIEDNEQDPTIDTSSQYRELNALQSEKDRIDNLLSAYEEAIIRLEFGSTSRAPAPDKDYKYDTAQGGYRTYIAEDKQKDLDRVLTEIENDPNTDPDLLMEAKILKAKLADAYIESYAQVGTAEQLQSITRSIVDTLDRAIRDSDAALKDYKNGNYVRMRKTSARERLAALKAAGYTSADINRTLKAKFKEFQDKQKEASPKRDKKRWWKSFLDKQAISIALNDNIDIATLDSLVRDLIEAEENGDGQKKLDEYKKILANEDIDSDIARHRSISEITVSAIRLRIAKVRQAMANNNTEEVIEFIKSSPYIPADVYEWAMNKVVKRVEAIVDANVYDGSEAMSMIFEDAGSIQAGEYFKLNISEEMLNDREEFSEDEANTIKEFNGLVDDANAVLANNGRILGPNQRAVIQIGDDSRDVLIVNDEFIKENKDEFQFIDLTNPNDTEFPVFYYKDALLTGLDKNTYNTYRWAILPSELGRIAKELESIDTAEYTDSGLNSAAALLENINRLKAKIKITDRFSNDEKAELLKLFDDMTDKVEKTIQTLVVLKQQRDADQVRVYTATATENLIFTQRLLAALPDDSDAKASVQALTTCTL